MSELKVPFFKAAITKEEEDIVLQVLHSGWLTTGKYAKEFEDRFTAAVTPKGADLAKVIENRAKIGLNTNDVISLAVNSNTSGMVLAMEACGVKEGTAVITTPYTFVSTAISARHLGAQVYFADVEKDNYNIDPVKIEEILKNDKEHKIKAIVPVHIAGAICKMEEICKLAQKYSTKENKIYVIEDAAHSFPSPTKLGYAGTIGDCGVFSFYVTKTITTAEGGMVCCRDKDLAKRMTVMRMHGMDRTTWDRYTSTRASWEYDIVAPGYKFNLPDLLAALGCAQVQKAEQFYTKRKKIVDKYNKEFSNLDFIELPPNTEGHSWHLYLMRIIPEKLTISREEFAKKLQEKGIGISVHFIPLFNFSYWNKLYPDFTAENYPNAQRQYSKTITIPLWPDMTEEMIDYVITSIKEIGQKYHA